RPTSAGSPERMPTPPAYAYTRSPPKSAASYSETAPPRPTRADAATTHLRQRLTAGTSAALEIAALVPAVSRWRKWVVAASALVGLGGAVSLYEAADLGGDLVYAYAGGVGIRSGDPADVGRLLVAGLYHQAMLERKGGKPADAAQLISQLAQRYPDDTSVRLLVVESLLVDKHDAKGALAALQWFPAAPDSRFL